jgi:hypothetical protein
MRGSNPPLQFARAPPLRRRVSHFAASRIHTWKEEEFFLFRTPGYPLWIILSGVPIFDSFVGLPVTRRSKSCNRWTEFVGTECGHPDEARSLICADAAPTCSGRRNLLLGEADVAALRKQVERRYSMITKLDVMASTSKAFRVV